MGKLLLLTAALLIGLISCNSTDNDIPKVENIAVESVSLNLTEFSKVLGAPAVNLTATVHPANATNQTVAWASSSNNIATVENGIVTAVSVGEAIITVITADGAHTATSTITVNPLPMECDICGELDCEKQHKQCEVCGEWNCEIEHTQCPVCGVWDCEETHVQCPVCNEWDCKKQHKECEVCGAWDCEETHVQCPVCNEWDCKKQHKECEVCGAWDCEIRHTQCPVCDAWDCEIKHVQCPVCGVWDCEETHVQCPVCNEWDCTEKCITYKNGVVINGIRWATRNVDMPGTFADSPEDAGMLYQWNRHVGWSSSNPLVNSNGGSTWNSTEQSGTEWTRDNDPCPTGWRVPTREELQTLISANSEWVTRNGVNGRLFGTAPNQIFLPAAGHRSGNWGSLSFVGTQGYYAQNAQTDTWTTALFIVFDSSRGGFSGAASRATALSVRCVAE